MTEKTLAERLRILPDQRLLLLADDAQSALVGPLPAGVRVTTADELPADGVDAALFFVRDAAELEERLTSLLPLLGTARPVWAAYPKGNRSDINRDSIWRRVEAHGWTLTGNIAVDDVWSAVRMKPVA